MRDRTVYTSSQVIEELKRVNWDFPRSSNLPNSVHTLHWFPGTFVAQIPSYLIQILSKVGDNVFDPFCGACTTGVEALLLNRNVWVSDSNPLSYLISRAKLSLIGDPATRRDLLGLTQLPWRAVVGKAPSLKVETRNPELQRWYHPDTYDHLNQIWSFIESCESSSVRVVLQMLFSDTLFACASTARSMTAGNKPRRHHWGWVADNVKPKDPVWHDGFAYFERRLRRAQLVAQGYQELPARQYSVSIQDARKQTLPSASADVVLTSPPYLGMIDYTTAARLTYLWFGWDLQADKNLEIGARHRRKSSSEPARYLSDIAQSSAQIVRNLKPGGYCAIVIGAARNFPDIPLKVIDIFSHQLQSLWGPHPRIPTRRRVSERAGTEPIEQLCVFQKNW